MERTGNTAAPIKMSGMSGLGGYLRFCRLGAPCYKPGMDPPPEATTLEVLVFIAAMVLLMYAASRPRRPGRRGTGTSPGNGGIVSPGNLPGWRRAATFRTAAGTFGRLCRPDKRCTISWRL